MAQLPKNLFTSLIGLLAVQDQKDKRSRYSVWERQPEQQSWKQHDAFVGAHAKKLVPHEATHASGTGNAPCLTPNSPTELQATTANQFIPLFSQDLKARKN